jgi:hypothetical protein
MSVHLEINAFFATLYRDAHVKNRIIAWTFVGLVFPTALLLALGVPAKPLYTVVFLLLLPLQFVVYRLSGRKAPAEEVPLHPTEMRVISITRTMPDIDAGLLGALAGKRAGRVRQVLIVDADGVVMAWRESLQGDSEREEQADVQSAKSLDPQLQAMLGKPVLQPVRMSPPFCFNA